MSTILCRVSQNTHIMSCGKAAHLLNWASWGPKLSDRKVCRLTPLFFKSNSPKKKILIWHDCLEAKGILGGSNHQKSWKSRGSWENMLRPKFTDSQILGGYFHLGYVHNRQILPSYLHIRFMDLSISVTSVIYIYPITSIRLLPVLVTSFIHCKVKGSCT